MSAQTMDRGRWNQVRDDLDNIIRLISCYELKEGTSLFELAELQAGGSSRQSQPYSRKMCRMDVPGPVKYIIFCSILGSNLKIDAINIFLQIYFALQHSIMLNDKDKRLATL